MEIKPQWIKIHKAIHGPKIAQHVVIDMQALPIQVYPGNGCRYVVYDGIKWMEQNQYKPSAYAARARAGEKITWGIRSPEPWILLDFKTVTAYEQQNNLDHAQGGPGVHREMHPTPVQRANTV